MRRKAKAFFENTVADRSGITPMAKRRREWILFKRAP